MVRSPRLSFKGYSFGEALYRNKDGVKLIVALIGTINVAQGLEWQLLGMSALGGVVALAGKLVLDAVDFYFSEVDL